MAEFNRLEYSLPSESMIVGAGKSRAVSRSEDASVNPERNSCRCVRQPADVVGRIGNLSYRLKVDFVGRIANPSYLSLRIRRAFDAIVGLTGDVS